MRKKRKKRKRKRMEASTEFFSKIKTISEARATKGLIRGSKLNNQLISCRRIIL